MIQTTGRFSLCSRRRWSGRAGGKPGKAEMTGFDRQRLLSALILVVIALFVSTGTPSAARWRRRLRLAAIIGFLIALAAALTEIVFWWTGVDR